MTPPCPPSVVDLTVQSIPLGAPDNSTAHIGGVAVGDRFVYATHSLGAPFNLPPIPAVGHLVIIDRAAFDDPNVVPVRVPVGFDPRGVAINPNNDTIYVGNRGAPTDASGQTYPSLSVVRRAPDTGLWTEQTQLKLPAGPADIAVNPTTNRVYVSNWQQRRIHVFTGTDNTELAPITDPADPASPFRPLGMTIDPATNTIYVALSFQQQPRVDALAVITLSGDEVQSIRRVPILPPRSQPNDVAFNSITKRLYVGGLGAAADSPPSVTVVDSTTLATVATIHTVAGIPSAGVSSLAVDIELYKIYAAVAGSIQVIDGQTNRISAPNRLTRALQSVALDRATGQLYTGDRLDGTIRRLTPVATDTPLGQHPDVAGGALGAPLGAARPTPDGQGTLQPFQRGTVVATTDYGAVVIDPRHTRVWLDGTPSSASTSVLPTAGPAAGFGNVIGASVIVDGHDLGNPTGDTATIFDEVITTYFERGMIASYPGGSEVVVAGAIWECYRDLGDITSFLAAPADTARDIPGGGKAQQFTWGFIVFHPDAGAHAMRGDFYDPWVQVSTSTLGYPITNDTEIVAADHTVLGRWVHFQHGAMVRDSNGLRYDLRAPFVRAWIEQGGPTGGLGMPQSSSTRAGLESVAMYTDFETATMVRFSPGHPLALPDDGVHTVTSLEMFISRFESGQSGDEVDLYVRYFLDDSNNGHREGTLPGDDDSYDTDDVNVDITFVFADLIRGDLKVNWLLRGRDDDSFPDPNGDDTIGVVSREYTVENLWGLADGVVSDTGHAEDGHFTPTWVMRQRPEPYDPTKPFRGQWFWQLDNFDTPRMTLDVYDQTFSDVHAGLQVHWNPLAYIDEGWEALFYQLYKAVGKDGNCFGMSVEALYAAANRSAFAEPIYQAGNPQGPDGEPHPELDKELIREINIKHGYQLGASAVRWYAQQIIPGTVNDGNEVFERSYAAYRDGNWPVLCMVRTWDTSGHVVLPIKWVERSDPNQPREIWLADPSRRPAADPDFPAILDHQWRILVHPDGSWTYRGSYNSAEPRWLFYVPFSRFSAQPRTPSWEALGALGLALGVAPTAFMLLGEADTHQISDASGRTLYQPGLGRPPKTPGDLRPDVDGRVPGLSRVPFFSAEDAPLEGELHVAYGRPDALVHEVLGRTDGSYHWGMRTGATAAIVSAPGDSVADLIHAERLGSAQRAISFARPKNTPEKQIKLMMEAMPRDRTPRQHVVRQYLLSDLPVAGGQRVVARIADGGSELFVSTSMRPTTLQLQLRGAPDAPLSRPRTVTVPANRTVRLRPADWSPSEVDSAPVRVEIREAPDSPPVQCFDVLPDGPAES